MNETFSLKSTVNALCLQTNYVCAKYSPSQAQDMQATW